MHGIVLSQLKDFVVETHDRDAWEAILREAGLTGMLYVPVAEYPDEDVLVIVEAAADLTGTDPAALQEAFGQFLVDSLVETYGVHVERDWTGLELIANVETYIHEALRAKQLSTYTPPEIEAARSGPDAVTLAYHSDRQLCHLVRGIIAGVGERFGESFDVDERTCMHDGADRCEFVVTRR